MVSVLFALLFIASVALNAILLVGCDTLSGGENTTTGTSRGNRPPPSRPAQSSEANHLKEI